MSEDLPKENSKVPAEIHNPVNEANQSYGTLSETPNELNGTENDNNMEIYHSHGNHHDRKLKDYVFEFFMLFLAVSAGFFMENMRESYVENHREKQYISSLIRDVQEDTTSMLDVIESNELQIKGIDSLLLILEKPFKDSSVRQIYFLTNSYLSNLHGFSARGVTITQLRNSGGLRLIDNKSVADSIVIYYETNDANGDQQRYNFEFLQDIQKLKIDILDYSAYRIKTKKYTIDESKLKELYNRTLLFKAMLMYEIQWAKKFRLRGVALLKYLKEEYRME